MTGARKALADLSVAARESKWNEGEVDRAIATLRAALDRLDSLDAEFTAYRNERELHYRARAEAAEAKLAEAEATLATADAATKAIESKVDRTAATIKDHIALLTWERDRALTRVEALEKALRQVTEGMDSAGGDRDGMPECPWCKTDGTHHESDCELARARAALAGRKP